MKPSSYPISLINLCSFLEKQYNNIRAAIISSTTQCSITALENNGNGKIKLKILSMQVNIARAPYLVFAIRVTSFEVEENINSRYMSIFRSFNEGLLI